MIPESSATGLVLAAAMWNRWRRRADRRYVDTKLYVLLQSQAAVVAALAWKTIARVV